MKTHISEYVSPPADSRSWGVREFILAAMAAPNKACFLTRKGIMFGCHIRGNRIMFRTYQKDKDGAFLPGKVASRAFVTSIMGAAKEPDKRGGKRPGAGRPKSSALLPMTFRLPPDVVVFLRERENATETVVSAIRALINK